MLKPVFLFLVAGFDVTASHLKKWTRCIEMVHLRMRLINDFFSYDKEKQQGDDYLRNLAFLLQEESIDERQARMIIIQLYNSLTARYSSEKDKPRSEQENGLLLTLELLNDIPLLVWNELAKRQAREWLEQPRAKTFS